MCWVGSLWGLMVRAEVAVGIVSAVACLASAVLGLLTTDATSNTINLAGFVLWLALILGISYNMYDRAPCDQVVAEWSAAAGHLQRGRT